MSLSVLCLHGRQQCGEVFSQRLRAVEKRLAEALEGPRGGKAVHFLHPDAPFELPLRRGDAVPMRSWYRAQEGGSEAAIGAVRAAAAAAAAAAVAPIRIRGILAFSQGCMVAAELLRCGGVLPDLAFVVLAGGLLPGAWPAVLSPMLDVPALIFAGAKDSIVPLAKTKALAAAFRSHVFHVHDKGHCFPSRADECRQIVAFAQRHCAAATADIPFERSEDLNDELEALESIYPDEFSIEREGRGCVVVVSSSVGGGNDAQTVSLEMAFSFTSGYPEEDAAGVAVRSSLGLSKYFVAQAQDKAREVVESSVGDPSVFAVVQELQELLESDAVVLSARGDDGSGSGTGNDDGDGGGGGAESKGSSSISTTHSSVVDKDGAIALHDDVGYIEPARLREITLEASVEARSQRKQAKTMGYFRRARMHWGNFTLGLIGKPSAGKSTFFNAAKTRGTRMAAVGAFPFTTIEPNIGQGVYTRTFPEQISCGGSGTGTISSISDGGADRSHIMEIVLKDVAGLVPGAYAGRGKGNRFLNDLCDADVLVHILDATGASDKQGNNSGSTCVEGIGDPTVDVEWIYEEVHRWVFGNVWEKFRHRIIRLAMQQQDVQGRIASLFTGYHCSAKLVYSAAKSARLSLECEHVASWGSAEVHRLVAFFVRSRFPILLAMNKCDDPRHVQHVERVKKAFPNEVVVAMSAKAEAELMLAEQRAADDETANVPPLSSGIMEKCTAMLGGTGVSAAIDASVELGWPQVVYIIQSTLSEGMTLSRKDVVPLLFRRGVTPADVYGYLKNSEDPRLRAQGIYIRAEAIGVGGARTVLKKDQVLDDSTCCIKVFTNRVRAWQNQSGGGEQKVSGGGSKNKKKNNNKNKKGGSRDKKNDGLDKQTRDRNKLIAKLHKSSDRQGKSKGGKGTGQSAADR
jgi:ribosome-binding ATPase YchF (GTP1/OBG family)/predicted esterase